MRHGPQGEGPQAPPCEDESGVSRHGGRDGPEAGLRRGELQGDGQAYGQGGGHHRRRQRDRPRRGPGLRPRGGRCPDLLPERGGRRQGDRPGGRGRRPGVRRRRGRHHRGGPLRAIIDRAVEEFGKVDILVNNAAFQQSRESIDEISTEEFDRTLKTNLYAMFWLTKAAVPRMPEGGAIINTTSIQADNPSPQLLPYAMTKAAIQNFTGGLAQMLGKKGIRVNCVAPGPIWTPLIPATMPPEKVKTFGKDVALGRPRQPAELAPVYVLLASDDSSYMAGATVAVTGGKPLI